MKAALFEKPHVLNVVSKDLRRLRDDEVLVKVEACGVCGTDVHIVEGISRSTPPVVLGHEYVGTVWEVGKGVANLRTGQRVAIDPNIACGQCTYCRLGLVHLCENLRALGVDIDGGMAEYCIVPAGQAYTLPEGMSADVAAFVEPVSCAVHGIDRAQICAGDTVVILGCGTVGLIMLQLAKIAGAARLIAVEPLEHKRAMAQRLGAEVVIDPANEDPKAVVFDTTLIGADVVIECVGRTSTVELALELPRRGGTVVIFGICPIGATASFEPNKVYFRELTITGSHVNPHTFSRAIALLASGKLRVDQFPISRFPLGGVHEALVAQRDGRTVKSIIQPNV